MKAMVYTQFGSPEVLQLRDVRKPEPREKEVLIRVYATTVVKEDPDMRAAPGFNGLLRPRNPILGQEFAGLVEAVGRKVTRFRAGDPVYGIEAFGGYAEYKCMAEDGALARMPAALSYTEAASIPNGALTALPFLRDKAQVRAGQRAPIYGASGSVGAAGVQLAVYYGAEVTGVCSAANLEMVRGLGASQVIDYTRQDFTTNGQRYEIIFDAVGKLSFAECKASLAETGVFLTTGVMPGNLLNVLLTARSGGRRAMFAATGLRPAREKAADLAFITGLVEAGRLRAVIDRSYPLEQMAEAHRYVEQGHKKGNVVITVI